MIESVTDILVARSRQREALKAMVYWSLAGHAAVLLAVLLWPGRWIQAPPETVMTITLGGPQGPRSGGLTEIGARPTPPAVEEARPAVAAPPQAPPKMTLPNERAKPTSRPKPRPAPPAETAKSAPQEAPTTGNARADTGVVRGQGFGLSSGGGSGGPIQLDVVDFCCPDYLAQMSDLITRSWDNKQRVVGSTTVKFTILRDGTIRDPQVEKPSGFLALDTSAMRALQLTKLPPLPAAFTNPTLTVHLRFDYQP